MILFFSGVFATIGLLLILGAGYMLGQKNTRTPTRIENEDAQDQRKKEIKMRKAFDNLMSYDLDKAYARKVN